MPHPAHDLDVLIVGAGISGLSAAWHLRTSCPGLSIGIVEAREAIGGTWDLFRYPGVRSDSDMYTLGFRFEPWRGERAIAAGGEIRAYLQQTADEHGLTSLIRFGLRVCRLDWDSGEGRWRVQAVRAGSADHPPHAGGRGRAAEGQAGDGSMPDATPDATPDSTVEFSCRFVFACSGYYRYGAGHQPDWPGLADYRGVHVHAQHWPEGLDLRGRRVVVIGSGATAVTLVPALAEAGAQVVQLQRTPSYLLARPARDALALALRRMLPPRGAWALTRAASVLLGALLFGLSRRRPAAMRRYLIDGVRRALPPGYDVETHFSPPYGPWRQRLCLVPDGDFFRAIRSGRAEVVTDAIERFTAGGIRLASGRELQADIVVSATGLQLQTLGGARMSLDGRPVATGELVNYKGVMYCGVPNFAATFGYTHASWTLKADLTSAFVCRVLERMRASGARVCVPRPPPADEPLRPLVDFSSGYFQRAQHLLPRQGSRWPWKLSPGYLSDAWRLRFGTIDDGVLCFDPQVLPPPR